MQKIKNTKGFLGLTMVIVTAIAIILIGTASYFILNKPPFSVRNILPASASHSPTVTITPRTCYDCGQSGWEKMRLQCKNNTTNTTSKDDFKNCLIFNELSDIKSSDTNDEIEDGYIEIGSEKIFKNPTYKSIKVYIYQKWAVDKNGTMYLNGELG